MQFIFDGKVYKVTKITGPKHNMLGLSFVENDANKEIEIVALRTRSDKDNNINASEVKEQVISAIKEINAELGVDYKVKQIQFVPSDTPSLDIYKELTMEIIKRLVFGNKFVKVR